MTLNSSNELLYSIQGGKKEKHRKFLKKQNIKIWAQDINRKSHALIQKAYRISKKNGRYQTHAIYLRLYDQ